MLLLPAPSERVAKDAARAVRRVAQPDVQEVTVETLSELLDLPGMKVTRFAIEEPDGAQYLHLFCEHAHEVAVCPRCLEIVTDGYDHKRCSVRHLDIWGMRAIVHFPQRRFDCHRCGKPFTENLAWIDPRRRQTKVFEEHIYRRVKDKTPRKQVALEAGLSETTVLEIFKKQAQQVVRRPDRGRVRKLGVDEISSQGTQAVCLGALRPGTPTSACGAAQSLQPEPTPRIRVEPAKLRLKPTSCAA